jgi:UDP-N-acetylmuramyl pentapeptide phosphotransferase/UDP-N-acetylglucosamine-1-phosphate transferase
MASIAFAILFALAGDISMLTLAVVTAGSLIPFFFHNVFGKTSKMFIGDGGTLVLGVVFSSFVINTLANGSIVGKFTDSSFGLIPFTLAVLSIPVFDTLRVMLARIMHGTSPFSPDKNHLHHLFIELGFSHAGTTVSILTLNTLIIILQLLSWQLGCSVDVQLYIVIGASLLCTVGFYYGMKAMSDNNIFKRMIKTIGRASRIERKGFFLTMQKLMDKI